MVIQNHSVSNSIGDLQQIRHLLIVESPKFKRAFSLEDASYSVGRHSDNSIVIPSPQVSRHHATF